MGKPKPLTEQEQLVEDAQEDLEVQKFNHINQSPNTGFSFVEKSYNPLHYKEQLKRKEESETYVPKFANKHINMNEITVNGEQRELKSKVTGNDEIAAKMLGISVEDRMKIDSYYDEKNEFSFWQKFQKASVGFSKADFYKQRYPNELKNLSDSLAEQKGKFLETQESIKFLLGIENADMFDVRKQNQEAIPRIQAIKDKISHAAGKLKSSLESNGNSESLSKSLEEFKKEIPQLVKEIENVYKETLPVVGSLYDGERKKLLHEKESILSKLKDLSMTYEKRKGEEEIAKLKSKIPSEETLIQNPKRRFQKKDIMKEIEEKIDENNQNQSVFENFNKIVVKGGGKEISLAPKSFKQLYAQPELQTYLSMMKSEDEKNKAPPADNKTLAERVFSWLKNGASTLGNKANEATKAFMGAIQRAYDVSSERTMNILKSRIFNSPAEVTNSIKSQGIQTVSGMFMGPQHMAKELRNQQLILETREHVKKGRKRAVKAIEKATGKKQKRQKKVTVQ